MLVKLGYLLRTQRGIRGSLTTTASVGPLYGAAGSGIPLNSSGDVQLSPREGARLLAKYTPGLTQLRMEFANAEESGENMTDVWDIRNMTGLVPLVGVSFITGSTVTSRLPTQRRQFQQFRWFHATQRQSGRLPPRSSSRGAMGTIAMTAGG